MAETTHTDRDQERLALMCALSAAIEHAISALESNNLKELQKQLLAQESLCNELAAWGAAAGETPGDIRVIPSKLAQEIDQAQRALYRMNRIYGSLISRVQRSFGLVLTLYRGFTDGYAPGNGSERHSWSCEV